MFTFSQLVDNVISRCQRPDRQLDIEGYMNQTLRDLNEVAYFARDLAEEQITISQLPALWTRPTNLRIIKAVYYPLSDIWPRCVQPGKFQNKFTAFYYATGQQFAFSGLGAGDKINIAYYTFVRRFKYFAAGSRPASYDEDTQTWTYVDPQPTTEEEAEVLQLRCSNWLLFTYPDCVMEGTLAKVYKSVDDKSRASTSYSLYMQMQAKLQSTERHESLQTDFSGSTFNG